ncbi:MAG: hypothetical protein EZS28_028494, partial [Streblomastix strix]
MADKASRASDNQSVSSTQSQNGALAIVRFNPFDEVVFAMFYSFHKEGRFQMPFWIFNLLVNTINYIGMTVRWHDWPI